MVRTYLKLGAVLAALWMTACGNAVLGRRDGGDADANVDGISFDVEGGMQDRVDVANDVVDAFDASDANDAMDTVDASDANDAMDAVDGDGAIDCPSGCAAGQVCVMGACVCNASSCPTGCCNGDVCVQQAGQSSMACGVGGAACSMCTGLTPTCAFGACTDDCGNPGDGTCASGCCLAGHCAAGSAAASCGGAGGMCVDCTASAVGHECVMGRCGCNSDMDCPTGQGCDTTTHECGCGPTTCTGCCDPATGICATPSPSACGSAGNTCSACAAGQACVAGRCTCDPSTCAGCCQGDTCVPTSAQTQSACGTAGAACGMCAAGQTCSGGSCVCDATSCPMGCCAGNLCVPFTAQTAGSCGTAGAACSACASGQSCTGGACTCDATSCPDGCCNGSTCVRGAAQNNSSCGIAGATCGACAAGQECVGGACVCDATSCPSGCCNGNVCVPFATQSDTQCGIGGMACGMCAVGQACIAGACGCNGTSCSGCCAAGVCVPPASETNSTCGAAGTMCQACAGLTPTCSGGACTNACGGPGDGPCAAGCCGSGQCVAGNQPTACGAPGGACVDCSANSAGHACVSGSCGCSSNADCGTGLLCNTTTNRCEACGPATCPTGCCDASGRCQTGNTTAACGGGGLACATCMTGQACGGARVCVCNAASCPSGCCQGNVCVQGAAQNNATCGTGGAACGACTGLTPTCAGGSCTGACGGSGNGTCTTGCCSSGTCAGGTTAGACGSPGGVCANCTTSMTGHICRAGGVCGCNVNADCPSGLLCNTTSHTCGTCNSTTCPTGCCDSAGMCQTAGSAGACGTGGVACATCSAGQACVAGACTCNAASCATGCCQGNSCIGTASQTNGTCGMGGLACASCGGLTPTCTGGLCTGACGATTPCTGGCCNGGTCAAGTSAAACGGSGTTCVNCTASATGHLCMGGGVCGCNANSDCNSGLLCNTTSHVCEPCGAGTCPAGCCNGTGQCVTGTSTSACGAGGGSCSSCATGQACVSGMCACTATSCATGCCSGRNCVPSGSQTGSQCGTGGAMCGACAGNANGTACVSGGCGCTSASDCPSGSVCNTTTNRCVAGGSCTLGPCAGCCGAGNNCTAGTTAGACGAGGGACANCTTSTPTCRTGAACSAGACTYSNAPVGTACGSTFCTVGQTCDASGNCSGGTPRDCTGGNMCLSCTCSNAGAGSCNCSTRAINAASMVTTTSSCMTATTGAQLAVVTRLVDASGTPVTGASVTFTPSNPAVTWVEAAVVESASQPGTYYRTMRVPATAGSTTVTVAGTWCSSTVTLTTTPMVSFVNPVPATGYASAAFQGVGGCTPVGGHVRVRVIEAETGNPISGANVLIGSSQGTPLIASAAQLFPTPTATGTNVGTTNAMGYVEFLDFGSSGGLHGPQIVTAAATNRANVTMYNWNGADQVLALPLRRPSMPTYRYTNGAATSIPARSNCTYLQLGFAIEDFELRSAATFDIASLFGAGKCARVFGMDTTVPENTYIPAQSLGLVSFLCTSSANASPWSATFDSGRHTLGMPFAQIPLTVAQTGDFVQMVQRATFQAIGFTPQNITANQSGVNIALTDTYPHGVTYNYSNQPANTDVEGLTMLDFTGGNGTGSLGISGVQVRRYNETPSVNVRTSTATTAPVGSRYVGALIATFLDPIGTRVIAPDVLNGTVSVFIRNAAGGGQPFDSNADATFMVNSFLALAPTAISSGNTVFTFGDGASAGQVPQYSVSTLTVQHTTFLPQATCETEPSTRSVQYPQWIVYRPRSLDTTACTALSTTPASCESFVLPTLPASFPNASAGTQKQSGFEQYIGSAAACTTTCAVAGESCVTPGPTLTARCMGNDGTNNFQESYNWQLEDRILGLTPTAVSAGSADLTQWRPGLTQSSANSEQWR